MRLRLDLWSHLGADDAAKVDELSYERDIAYTYRELDQPVSTTFHVGLPVAPPTPLDDERLRAGTDVVMPTLVRKVQPDYPDLAVRARVECTVNLEAVIGKTGEVLDIKLLRGCALGLDEAALEAVYQWVYTPTLVRGRPVELLAHIVVHFELHQR